MMVRKEEGFADFCMLSHRHRLRQGAYRATWIDLHRDLVSSPFEGFRLNMLEYHDVYVQENRRTASVHAVRSTPRAHRARTMVQSDI